MANYKPVIGLEIHVELKTKSKMFCQCSANYFGKKPNTNTCPVCLGLPGALPVPNEKAIEWTILIGKALNCTINKISKFDRKHYFYPDLPKGYQISQYDEPIAVNGQINIVGVGFSDPRYKGGNTPPLQKIFRIRRVHLEEDTGKLIHSGNETLIDFNRSGVPLVEIVTEPDFDNSDDVKRFLEELRVIIRYLDVSDADMEKGSMRLEPNISVREIPNSKFQIPNKFQLPKYKVEVKNINSFRYVKQAIEYELERQKEILEKGETPRQETRGFDEKKVATYSQRSKEEAHDYRYFPEPDIPPLTFTQDYISSIIVPELPQQKVERYVMDYQLKFDDAFRLTRDLKIANLFINIINNKEIKKNNIPIKFIANLFINSWLNKLRRLPEKTNERYVDEVVDAYKLRFQIGEAISSDKYDVIIDKVIAANQKVVDEYRKGKENAIMFLVGQVMREMKGKAEAKLIISKIKDKISN